MVSAQVMGTTCTSHGMIAQERTPLPTLGSSPAARPTSVPALLAAMADRPTPALVFYDHNGDRVELSGRVFENWTAKTANLLTDDLALQPGDRVLLDTPVHWRCLALAAGVWRLGGVVVLPHGATEPTQGAAVAAALETTLDEQLATTNGDAARRKALLSPAHDELLVLGYDAMASSVAAQRLPAGAIDFCAEIRAHGDHFAGSTRPDTQTVAVVDGGQELSYGQLQDQAAELAAQLEDQAVRAVHLQTHSWSLRAVVHVLGAWLAGANVIIIDPGPAGRSEAELQRLLNSERVGLVLS